MKTINILMVLALALGAAVFPANADLTLPYAGSISTDANAFSITITGGGKGAALYGKRSSSNFGYIAGRDYAVYGMGGVHGESYSFNGSVTGKHLRSSNLGGLGCEDFGVYGETWNYEDRAVYGLARGGYGYGIYGLSAPAAGNGGIGVYGEALVGSDRSKVFYGGCFVAEDEGNGRGIYAAARFGGYAAEFNGKVIITSGDIDDIWCINSQRKILIELGEGLDYAEGFDVSNKSEIAAGSVLVIDANNPGKLRLSNTAYDKKVAGIVAGAKGQGSAVRVGVDKFDFDVSLAGRVYCNVDATEAAVEPGDLLTTSSTPGYAMKAVEYMRAQGATLGKAMERLEKGKKGQILVLVTLQ